MDEDPTGSRWAPAVCVAFTGSAAAELAAGGQAAVDAVEDLILTVEADRWPGHPADTLWWATPAGGGVVLHARCGVWR